MRYGFRPAGWRVHGHASGTAYSLFLKQNDVALVVTSALDRQHPAFEYVRAHGDGVANIAFAVDDVDAFHRRAVQAGARSLTAPFASQDGRLCATIAAFGDVTHTLIETTRRGARAMPPGFHPLPDNGPLIAGATPARLLAIDHFAVCLPHGALAATARFYEEACGMRGIFAERTVVGAQTMDSRVVQSASGQITLTLLEPAAGSASGQIAEFVERHGGAGVQHIAFLTDDIVDTVDALQQAGVGFLRTPGAYYDMLPMRLTLAAHDADALRRLDILVDEDDDGQLFQIFTESAHARRTLFFELIERRAARTFGSGNIEALYRAVAATAAAAAPS
jgi:4-hydroxymandelate synthase